MEKLIHQYLESNYYLYEAEGNRTDWIYALGNDESSVLLQDLVSIYALEVVEIKLFVYTWAIKHKIDVDLSNFWEVKESEYNELINRNKWSGLGNLEGLVFPMVQRVMARTIGLDLVNVQPMSGPTGTLFYLDYQYGDKPKSKKKTIYQKLNEVWVKVKIFIGKIQKDIEKYLHVSNYNTTFVTRLE